MKLAPTLCLALALICSSLRAEAPGPAAAKNDSEISATIEALGSPVFREREKAQAELIKQGLVSHTPVLDACLRAAVTNQDVEVHERLEEILAQLVDRKLYNAPRGFLGIRLMKETILYKGKPIPAIAASEVLPDTGAAKAGMMTGDIIINCDEKPIPDDPSINGFIQYIQSHPPGYTAKLVVLRNDKEMNFSVVLGDRPQVTRGFPFRQEKPFDDYFREWRAKEHLRLGLPPLQD